MLPQNFRALTPQVSQGGRGNVTGTEPSPDVHRIGALAIALIGAGSGFAAPPA
jgi:hypothetical protein